MFREPIHTRHKPIHKKHLRRCRVCFKRLVPDQEWFVWITEKEMWAKLDRKRAKS